MWTSASQLQVSMENWSYAFATDKYISPLPPSRDRKKEVTINLPISNNFLCTVPLLHYIISFHQGEKSAEKKSRWVSEHEQAIPTGECVFDIVHRAQTGGKLEIRFMRNWCWFLTVLNLQSIVFRGVSVSRRQRRESKAGCCREVGSRRLAWCQDACCSLGIESTGLWLKRFFGGTEGRCETVKKLRE